MPTVTLSKKAVEELMKKKLSQEELKDRISMLGTDLDGINGDDIEVEIFPNRPDMLSEQGFARALGSFIGETTGLKKYNVQRSDYKVLVKESVKKVRPYTVCAVVKDLKLDDEKIRELIQIQEKLHVSMGRNRKKLAIGIYPLEAIKMPITYEGRKPQDIRFEPLEADKEMTGSQILSKHPTGRDYGHLLEGHDSYPVFVDATGEIMSMPPIINSKQTGKVNEDTKEIFIECSGSDIETLKKCLAILTTALSDMGSTLYEVKVVYKDKTIKTPQLEPEKKKVDRKYINKRIGIEFSEQQIQELLSRMGIGYEKGYALIPAYRTDILHQIDLAEEVAIAYGYENFKEEIPNVTTIGKEDQGEILKKKISEILIGHGLMEVITYHLTNLNTHNKNMRAKEDVVKISNSANQEYSILRKNLIPSLMDVMKKNTNHEYPQNIFEQANTFHNDKITETGVREEEHLAVALCAADIDYTKIKQILQSLMDALDIAYTTTETKHPSFIEGRTAQLKIKDTTIGIIGELHPEVIAAFEVEVPIAAMEINLEALAKEVYR